MENKEFLSKFNDAVEKLGVSEVMSAFIADFIDRHDMDWDAILDRVTADAERRDKRDEKNRAILRLLWQARNVAEDLGIKVDSKHLQDPHFGLMIYKVEVELKEILKERDVPGKLSDAEVLSRLTRLTLKEKELRDGHRDDCEKWALANEALEILQGLIVDIQDLTIFAED